MSWNVPNCQKTLLGIWVFGIYPGKMLVRVWQTISFPISELKCLQTAQIKFASIAFRPKKGKDAPSFRLSLISFHLSKVHASLHNLTIH